MRHIVGIHAVRAQLKACKAQDIEGLYLEEGHKDPRLIALQDAARAKGVRVSRVPEAWIVARTPEDIRHQGVLLILRRATLAQSLPELMAELGSDPLFLALDGVTDPHNLGACLRSAHIFGANALLVPRDRAANSGAVVEKVSSGAAAWTPLLAVTNLSRALETLQHESRCQLIGLCDDAPDYLHDLDLTGPLIILLGSEGTGIREHVRQRCDRLARIPGGGQVPCLNVSNAAAVALYEAYLQRQRVENRRATSSAK